MALFLCFVAIFFYFSRNKLKAKRLRGDARVSFDYLILQITCKEYSGTYVCELPVM